MMITPATNANALPRSHEPSQSLGQLQLTGYLLPESGEPCAPNLPSSSLWTDGLPDPDKIKIRMAQTEQAFLNHVYPEVREGRFRYLRWIRMRRVVQDEFYASMSYYESLLYAAPVLSLRAESSTTTVISEPYQPRAKPRRGRPSTGGRKARPTKRKERTKEDDTSY